MAWEQIEVPPVAHPRTDLPVLSARKALQATEVIFATYESARRDARVDLPLEVEVDPFTHMREPVA